MNAMMSRKTKAPLVLHAETAEDVMAPNPISIRAEAGVPEAIVLFTEKGIAAAPVIDEAGRPIGVVSRSDLLIHLTALLLRHLRHPDRAGTEVDDDGP